MINVKNVQIVQFELYLSVSRAFGTKGVSGFFKLPNNLMPRSGRLANGMPK